MLDASDRRILRHMQADPDAPVAELAERARLTVPTTSRRIERMKDQGIIRTVSADIDWAALGYEVIVSLRVTLDKTNPNAFDEFLNAARDIAEAVELQTFLGRVDARLSVIARDMPHYQSIYRNKILALPHIQDIEALMHVATIKSDEALPL